MKRLLSIIVSALVAVSFAGIVSAVDSPTVPAETMDTKSQPPYDVPTVDGTTKAQTKDTTKKKKKRRTKKSKKSTRPATSTEPNYGTPATGGPSGTMGAPGATEDGAGAGGAGTGGAGR